jgi:mono/diheme cytochrome c family protein
LNGLNALDYDLLKTFIYTNDQSEPLSHAIVLLEQFATSDRVNSLIKLTKKLILKKNPEIDFYILSALGSWTQLSKDDLFPLLYGISDTYKDSKLHQEGLVSSLSELEDDFLLFLEDQNTDLSNSILLDILNVTISNKNSDKKNFIYTQKTVGTDARTSGYNIYRNFCATCHGINGEGIDNLAPPLQNSEYISKSSERLALVILHGLSGPIHVNGKPYKLNVSMPGLVNNPEFKDEDVNNIIKYVTSAFSDNPKSLELEKIKLLREHKPQNAGGFTEEELLQLEN